VATTSLRPMSFPAAPSANSAPSTELVSGLSPCTSDALRKASQPFNYPAGDVLFSEGEAAKGVWIIREGKVKLVASSSDGKALILRIASVGTVLGLSSVVLDKPQEITAEVVQNCSISFIKRQDLLRLMSDHGDLALQLAKELSFEYNGLCQELSTIGLQRSASSRLAQLFISWCDGIVPIEGEIQLECTLTHEVIAQLIGTSRETVTRLLHDLRVHKIAMLRNDVLVIHDYRKLKGLSA
jgi:CRP/FNR family transcriptional regulator, cyclic AMP receptor protein